MEVPPNYLLEPYRPVDAKESDTLGSLDPGYWAVSIDGHTGHFHPNMQPALLHETAANSYYCRSLGYTCFAQSDMPAHLCSKYLPDDSGSNSVESPWPTSQQLSDTAVTVQLGLEHELTRPTRTQHPNGAMFTGGQMMEERPWPEPNTNTGVERPINASPLLVEDHPYLGGPTSSSIQTPPSLIVAASVPTTPKEEPIKTCPCAHTIPEEHDRSNNDGNRVAEESLPILRINHGAWKCALCGKELRRKQRAVMHYWNKHGDVRVSCRGRCGSAGCQKSFTSQEGLDKHLDPVLVECSSCGRILLKKNILRHKERHCHFGELVFVKNQ